MSLSLTMQKHWSIVSYKKSFSSPLVFVSDPIIYIIFFMETYKLTIIYSIALNYVRMIYF